MAGIIGIIAFLTVLLLSLVITQIATIALTMTGLSHEAARFQARSAFTGTGFTTNEAEEVVNHPVRRKIIMLLMVTRSAGLVTIVISLILSFAGAEESRTRVMRLLILSGGIGVMWAATRSRLLREWLSMIIQKALNRWTQLDTRDYVSLLRLTGPYSVTELQVQEGDWLEGKELSQCSLREEGITLLGITREDGTYIGVPQPSTKLYPKDTLLLYGRSESMRELDERRQDFAGEQSHQKAVSKQQQEVKEQDRQEEKSKRIREARKGSDNQDQ